MLIRNNDNILGIKIGSIEFLISQYADDTTFILDGSEKSLENCLLVLKFYADASGLCINLDKTKVVWIGSKLKSAERLCQGYNLHWVSDEFTILGIIFPKDLKDIVEINYRSKLEEIKRLLVTWSKRILTPIGKIAVIKSLALSKINHLILALPNPSKHIIKELQNMFYKYLWSCGPDKIKRNIIIQPICRGGLKMIDLENFISSLKITWIRRLIMQNCKCTYILNNAFPYVIDYFKFGSAFIDIKRKFMFNVFWKDVFDSYKVLQDKIIPNTWFGFLQTPIWFNDSIKVGGSCVFYRRWLEKGIYCVNDLLNEDGDFVSLNQFRNKFSVQVDFLTFEGLLNSIRFYFRSLGIDSLQGRLPQPCRPLNIELIMKDKKGCKTIYELLIKPKQPILNISLKWQASILLPEDFNWNTVFNIPFKISQDTQLRWFQYRINHRILGTNYLLKKMNKNDSALCTFCNEKEETITHLFWECQYIEHFWKQFSDFISSHTSNIITNWGKLDILFGNPLFEDPLNLILIKSKQFIYRMKMKKSLPIFETFKMQLHHIFKTEEYIAKKKLDLETYRVKWENYRALFE